MSILGDNRVTGCTNAREGGVMWAAGAKGEGLKAAGGLCIAVVGTLQAVVKCTL